MDVITRSTSLCDGALESIDGVFIISGSNEPFAGVTSDLLILDALAGAGNLHCSKACSVINCVCQKFSSANNFKQNDISYIIIKVLNPVG